MSEKKINIGILGFGTVGTSVYRILKDRKKDLKERFGLEIVIKKILEKDKSRASFLGDEKDLMIDDFDKVVNDEDIDIIVELIGGINPANSFIMKALENNKNIVTANKELMATYGEEILKKASERGLGVHFEASVGGGVPIIKPLKESLGGNKISKVLGIVNGTTNYILTKMADENESFKEALKDAQERGYAEANPEADVEGKDAAAKIAILASLAFNSRVNLDDVFCEGISKITTKDINYAQELGFVIKLLAIAKDENREIEVRVHPAFIPESHPLASVKGIYNAIFIEGDAVGEVMFFGKGAGGMAAGSSVVGDIIDLALKIQSNKTGVIESTYFKGKRIKNIEEIITKYYILIEAYDKPGVLAKISKAFGDNKVSLSSVIQWESIGKEADIVFMTHLTRDKDVQKSLLKIKSLDVVRKVRNVIRVEAL
ncbi:MAG: homoserine dehydrogenase [Actinomycetia bacterium]|nr:homoserine dehydrogenase [Actinomycetes bacterium]